MVSNHNTTDSTDTGRTAGQTKNYRRRRFIKAAGATGAIGLTGFAGCTGGGGGDSGPITLGGIYLLSGFASVYGESAQLGIEMARQEINANGGINGREIGEVVYRDSEGSASTGVSHARELVQSEDVDLLIGLDSSGVSLQVAPIMEQLQVPLMVTHAATPFITNQGSGDRAVGNDYVFRAGNNLAQNVYGAATTASNTDAQSWTTVGPNYAFGTQSWEYFKAYTQAMGLDYEYLDDAAAYPELGSGSYTAQINQVLNGDPDGVVISLWGSDLVTFLRQAKNTDFFESVDQVLMTLGAATDALRPLGDEMPTDLWAGTRYWFLSPDTETNTQFRQQFLEEHPGRPPSYNAQNAYTGMHLYRQAIEEAGGVEPDGIISALEGMEYSAPMGDLRINPESHQAEVPAVWGKTARSDDWDVSVLDPVNRIETPPSTLRDLLSGTGWPAGV